MLYLHSQTCLVIAFREWNQLCHLSDKGVHADDALEPPRVGVEQMREGGEDAALRSAYQRTVRLLKAFAAIEPSCRTRLQQRDERKGTSAFQGQVIGQLPVLQLEGRAMWCACYVVRVLEATRAD